MLLGKIAEEVAYDLALVVREIADVVELMQCPKVGKHLVGLGHVLVDVVEVSQQHLSPSVEVI